LGLPAYDKETSRSILDKLAREAELTVAVAEDLEKYKTLAKKNPKQALADLGMKGYDREHASEVLRQVIRRVEA
jgi:CheY-like chemotaxis protein